MRIATIIRGDDTDFAGQDFVGFEIESELDLTGFKAKFQMGTFVKVWDDITSKMLDLSFSAEESLALPLGENTGAIAVIDADGKLETMYTDLVFYVEDKVVDPIETAGG